METCLRSDTLLDRPGTNRRAPIRRSAMTPDPDNRLHLRCCRTGRRHCPHRRAVWNSAEAIEWSPIGLLSAGFHRALVSDVLVVCWGKDDVRGSSPGSGRWLCFVAESHEGRRLALMWVAEECWWWSSVGRWWIWAGEQEGECRLQDERRSGIGWSVALFVLWIDIRFINNLNISKSFSIVLNVLQLKK